MYGGERPLPQYVANPWRVHLLTVVVELPPQLPAGPPKDVFLVQIDLSVNSSHAFQNRDFE
jgi:hypothetical protein